MIVIQF